MIQKQLWCDKHAPSDVKKACEESLSKLGLEYIDLYLVHFPVSFQYKKGSEADPNDPNSIVYENIPIEDTWKVPFLFFSIFTHIFLQAMEELVPAGLAKSIGISNFNKSQVDRILKICKIKPAVNQVEVNLHWPNTKLLVYCHSQNIQVEGYSPFRSPKYLESLG